MLPLLPAYHAFDFVDTIQTNDVHTGGVHTTLRPRQWRGRRHLMPALGCDGERVCHFIVVTNMVIPDTGDCPVTRVIRETNDLLQLISLGELILEFSYPDGRK